MTTTATDRFMCGKYGHTWRVAPDGLVSCLLCGHIDNDSFSVDPTNPMPSTTPHCECGAQTMGIRPYYAGHSHWCPVS
jgi:hypothetical protein